LITRGVDALYDLSPFECHGLFSLLLAALGDTETMEGWLASTEIPAEVDLCRDPSHPEKKAERLQTARDRPPVRQTDSLGK
jgi:hypothetical protein